MELAETGDLQQLQELRQETPTELTEMMDIEGLGPKRVANLHEELDIATLDDLMVADKGVLREISEVGSTTANSITTFFDEDRNRRAVR